MRKSFTRFLGLLMVFTILGFQMVFAAVDTQPSGTNVEKGFTKLTLTFDNTLIQGDAFNGAVITLRTGGFAGAIVDAVTLPSTRFHMSGKQVVIDIVATTYDNTTYYVNFLPNIVKESKADGNTPNNSLIQWSFATGDFTAPKLVANTFSPPDGITNVGSVSTGDVKSSTFKMTFNEAVKGVNGKYIKVYKKSDGSVHEMINAANYTTLNTVVTFTTSNLREKTEYYILVDDGAFTDATINTTYNKKPFAGISDKTMWEFTTRDYSAAVFANTYPKSDNVLDNKFDVKANLDETGTVYYKVFKKADIIANPGWVPTSVNDFIDPLGSATGVDFVAVNSANSDVAKTLTTYVTAPHVSGGAAAITAGINQYTEYYVYYIVKNNSEYFNTTTLLQTADALFSSVGRISDAIYTKDITAPTVSTHIPALSGATTQAYLDGGTAYLHGPKISMDFSEEIVKGTGSILIKRASDNVLVEAVDVASSAVEIVNGAVAKGKAEIKLSTKLASGILYYITMPEGIFTDKSLANKYAGIISSTTWRFTVTDYEAPTVTFSNPANSNLLQSGEGVTLTFNEDIYGGPAGAALPALNTIIAVEKNNGDVTGSFTLANPTSKTLTVVPTGTWDQNSSYVVKLLKEKIYDLAGNQISLEKKKTYAIDSWGTPGITSWTSNANPISSGAINFSFTEAVELISGVAIDNSTIAGLITFSENGGAPVPFTATYAADTRKVTITPSVTLTSGGSYTINVSNGYRDFNVVGGKKQGVADTKTYTIKDSVKPVITFDFVNTNVATVTPNLDIKFSEPIFNSGGIAYSVGANANNLFNYVTLREGNSLGSVIALSPVITYLGSDTYRVTPVNPLTEGATYYLAFANDVVYDLKINNVVNKNIGASTTFVTKTTPALVSRTPGKDAEGVSKSTNNVSLTFSENVKLNSGYTSTFVPFAVVSGGALTTMAVKVLNSTGDIVAYCQASSVVFVGNTVTIPLSKTTGYGYSIINFTSGEQYTVMVDAGLIFSANNNAADAITYSFKIEDYAAPVLSGAKLTAPAASSASNMSDDLKLTFNEPVKKGSGTIIIQKVGAVAQEVIDVNSGSVSIDWTGTEVSIKHNAFVASLVGTVNVYKVVVTNGAIVDKAGNAFAGLVNDVAAAYNPSVGAPAGTNLIGYTGGGDATTAGKQWYFSTALNAAPLVSDYSKCIPKDDADKVALTTNLVMTFNEPISVVPGTGGSKKISLYLAATATIAQEYNFNQPNVTVSGSSITVDLVDLLPNTGYYVLLEAGAVQDSQGEPNVAVTVPANWNFNTGDVNAPVASVVVQGTYKSWMTPKWQNVDHSANIVVNFDEAIRLVGGAAINGTNIPDFVGATVGTLSGGKIVQLYNSTTNTLVDFTASISADKMQITIVLPAAGLVSIQEYTLLVGNYEDSGSHGTSLAPFKFVVDDYDGPIGSFAGPKGVNVLENIKGTEVKVEFDYNENANVYYQLLAASAGTPLASSVIANGTMLAVDDVAGATTKLVIPTSSETKYNLFVVPVDRVHASAGSRETIPITTADITAPSVVAYVNNGKLDVDPTDAAGFKITLKFAKPVQAGSGSAYIYRSSDNVLITTLGVGAIVPSADRKEVSLTISAGTLGTSTAYYLVVDKGFVTDVWDFSSDDTHPDPIAGTPAKTKNPYAGFSDNTTYTFSTKDNVGPTVSSVTPRTTAAGTQVGSVGTAIPSNTNSDIVITFNEKIQLGSDAGAGDVIINKPDGSIHEVIILTSANILDTKLTINPSIDFVDGWGPYTVVLKPNVIKDLSGNNNAGTIQWLFDVSDKIPAGVTFKETIASKLLSAGPIKISANIKVDFTDNVWMLSESKMLVDDLDTLVSLKDAAGAAVDFDITSVVYSGNYLTSFTVDPVNPLKSLSSYTISFGAVFKDDGKNITPAQSVTFSTVNAVSPTVVFVPVKDTEKVSKGQILSIEFNQSIIQVDPTTTEPGFFSTLDNNELENYLEVTDEKDETGAIVNQKVAIKATISANKKLITIKPVIDLLSGHQISLKFNPLGLDNTADGTYADLADSLNNEVVVPSSKYSVAATFKVNFTVEDYMAPFVTGTKYSPNNGAYLLDGAKLAIEFNEEVKAGTGDVKIYRKDGTLAETINASNLIPKSDNKKIIEFSPGIASRANNTEYYVLIPAGAIVDNSGNAFVGTLNDNFVWTYATADGYNPLYTSLSPISGSNNVSVNQNLVITFEKKVVIGSGDIAIYKKSGADAFDLLRVTAPENRVRLDASGLFVTIDFTRTLDSNTEYFVTVEPGTFLNAKAPNTKFNGIMDKTVWTFSTEDTSAPTLASLDPLDDKLDVPYMDALSLKMTFNGPVAKGTIGSLRVVKTDVNLGTTVETIDIANATISADKKTVTFPMTLSDGKSRLTDATAYHVFVDYGAITNDLPNKTPFVGINAKTEWNFTTAKDVTAPTATFTPVNGSLGLTLKPVITMTFSEPVAVGTGIISIYKASDNTLVESLTGTVSGNVATFPLPTLLKDATNYYVKVGADAFKDKATTPVYYAGIADATTWTFATGDNSAPVAIYTPNLPTNNNEKTGVTLTMTFDEEVVVGAGKLTLYSSSDVVVKEFTAAELKIEGKVVSAQVSGLVDNTTYYLKADAGLVKDKAVNGPFDFKGISNTTDWTFKVGDNTAPTVTATPDKGDTMAKTFDVVLTFSEKVTGVTATDLVITGAAINSVTADVTGKIYTVNITGLSLAKVTLNVPTTVKDMNGNAFVAIPAFNYTIDDFSTPVLVSWTPADETSLVSYNIKNDTSLVMTFSKPIFAGTGQIYVYNSLNQLFNKYSVTAANIVGKVVTIPITGLKDKDTYVVTFDSGVVIDKHGVQIAALVDPTVWNFTVGDYSAPILVSAAAPAAPIKTTFDVVLTFNEAVKGVVPAAITVTNGTLNTISGSGAVYTLNITAAEEAVVGISLPATITDASINSNKYAGKTLSYTVGDFTAPKVAAVSTVVKNDVTVVLTFSADAIVTASDITVAGATSNTITNVGNVFTVAAKANDMATVLVTVASTVVDEAGNKITGDLSVSNLVLDNTAPTVVSVTPETATAAKNSFDVTVVFSEDVVIGTDNITVSKGTVAVTGTGKTYVASIKAADGDVVVLTIGTGVKDASGRNNLAVAVAKTYTIGDNTAPTLEVFAPVTPVAKTFTVGLKFKEAVTGVSATSITVVGGTLSSLTGTGADYTLTIAAEEKATVKINVPKTVADLAGNLFAGQDLEYTVGDFTAPIVTADPASGENLKKTFSVVLTFSADAIVKTSDITAVGGTIVVNPIVGNVCKVDVTAADKATVVLSVASTVADAAGNKLVAPTSFTYKVGDNTAPTVTITGPTAPIETSFIVSFNFSEVVTGFSRTSLTVTNGTIKQFVGVGADYLVSIVADEKAVVKLSIPADAVVDASGNKLAAKDATFTVGDFSAPKVTVTPPASPVATVFSIGLKFDEPVSGLLLGGSAVTVTNGKIVDITGKNDSYTVVVSALEMTNVKVVITDAIADLAGNKFAGLTLNYTTGDFTAPQLVAMSPTIDDVLANNHPLFKMTFSENVKLGAGGNLSVYKVNTTTPVLTIPITEAMILGKIVTIDYTTKSGLDKDARYYVMVDATALTDMAGNAFVGVSDAAAWTLKTGKEFITKIDPNSSLEFKVYPNPFVDFVNVDNASQLSKVVVSNIAGQVVKEVVTPTDRIQLNELRSGIYFMSLYNTDNVIVKTAKIVKR